MRSSRRLGILALSLACLSPLGASAQMLAQPATQPADATQPAAAVEDVPTTQAVATTQINVGPMISHRPEAKVSPEARKLLDQVRDAYGKADTLELSGNLAVDIQFTEPNKEHNEKESAAFEGTYQSPNKFRELVKDKDNKDEMMLGGTGPKLFAYAVADNKFMLVDAPKQKGRMQDLPDPVGRILRAQNPALALAMSSDADKELLNGASEASASEDKIGDKTYPVLSIASPGGTVQFFIDPETHLIRRQVVDLKQNLLDRGAPEVKTATMMIDYTKIAMNPGAKVDQFDWTPPANAKDAAQAGGETEGAATALVGKPAPDFKLDGLDGKPVALADLKGSVVVLDFWATWCGPCVMALPHVDKVAQDYAAKGVKVFGINMQEDKEKVAAFLKEKNLTLPVLLEVNGETAQKYMVEGIPETVIIGKDGVVSKVLIGANPATAEADLKAAVDGALGQK